MRARINLFLGARCIHTLSDRSITLLLHAAVTLTRRLFFRKTRRLGKLLLFVFEKPDCIYYCNLCAILHTRPMQNSSSSGSVTGMVCFPSFTSEARYLCKVPRMKMSCQHTSTQIKRKKKNIRV
jgi:hypothetical protein